MQFKYAVCFIAIIAALLIFMNIYPVASFRDAAFEAKHASTLNQAAVVASSLSSLPELREEDVGKIMSMLNNIMVTRLVVTNERAQIIYDTSQYENNVGRYAVFAEVMTALEGKDVFRSKYTGEGLVSRAAMPVTSEGVIVGAVYIYDFDIDQAGMLETMRGNLLKVSFVILFLSLLLVFVFSWLLTKRIRSLFKAMQNLGGGRYDYRVEVRGGDEISGLASEFNSLAERLEKTESMRQRFVSDASHELKTPLASIRLLADSVVQNENVDAGTMREFMADIGSEAERLQRTTEKLLALSRLDDDIQIVPEPVDVRQVTLDALSVLRPLAEERSVSIRTALDDGCVVLATVDDMFHIVFNLMENAIKYNVPNGSVGVFLHIGGDSVLFTVEDTGIGIPESETYNIFSRFYRIDKARSREAGGSGLGLSIVHDAVKAHGGSIAVGQNKPQGSRFIVSFPLYSIERT